MITENLSTLKIHRLTQAQYNRELANGTLDEKAIYLTPDECMYATAFELSTHTTNVDNPHQVTAAQVGADPAGSAAKVQANLDAHLQDKGNPHGVTLDTIGAAAASHHQAASTITAGTFAGQVAANASGQAAGTSLLRNSKLVSAEENPTTNGEICWTYK